MELSRTGTRIIGLVAFGVLAWLILRIAASARWFDLYGTATVLLAVALPLGVLLWQGLSANGRSRWPAVAVALVLAIAAAAQIVFWMLFFSSPELAIRLGVARTVAMPIADTYLPVMGMVFTTLVLWVTWRAAGRRTGV